LLNRTRGHAALGHHFILALRSPAVAGRLLTYLGLLYEALLARKLIKPGEPLPVVLPVVVYSGVPRWNAALNVCDLIGAVPQGLRRFLPQLQYLLVDEGALVESGKLPMNNLAALLFQLEHNRGLHDVEDLIQKVYNYTKADPLVRRAFATWTRHVLLPRSLPDVDMPQIDNLLEIKNMLAEHSRSWTHQWKMEGLAEGRKEGRKEGQAAILRRLLAHKFGPLPDAVSQRLKNATSAQLEAWSLAVLDANSLEEVFSD